ncbi:MAG: ATP-binding protein [Clostridiales bacterium]|nr:ATP-binding protein [Clostridiales bacterium]
MLLQFKVKNFKSIGDEITLDLVAGSGSEHRQFVVDEGGVGVLPVASIYGGNASGKSNIIDALSSMLHNICYSYKNGSKDFLHVTPFLYDHELRRQPTEFEIFFSINGREYQYGYKATRDNIASEWMYDRKLSKNNTQWRLIFERRDKEIAYGNAVAYQRLKEYNGLVGSKMLLLSFLGNMQANNTEAFSSVYEWVTQATFGNWVHSDNELIEEMQYRYEDLKANFIEFINEFDPCLEDIIVEKETGKDGKERYRVFSVHNGEKYPFDIESDGTTKLFRYFTSMYIFFNNLNGVLIADEIDSQLHPLILRRIVSMFHNKEINKKSSQLIFTSHNLIVLDNRDMRRDEIWFTEKDDRGFTNLYSLAEFKANKKEIRADLNYGNNYLAGKFGAIPYLNLVEGDQ